MSAANSYPESITVNSSLPDELLTVPKDQQAALAIFGFADVDRRLKELGADGPLGSLFSSKLGAATISLFAHAYKNNQRIIYKETNWSSGSEAVYDYLLTPAAGAVALRKVAQPIPYDSADKHAIKFNRFSAPALCYRQNLGELTVHYGSDYADVLDSCLPEPARDDLAQQLVGQLALFDLSDRLAVRQVNFRQVR